MPIEPRIQILGGIERPEVAGVVGYQNEIPLDGMVASSPSACLPEMRDMMSLKFRVLGFAREFDAQVFIDKKPLLAVASLMWTTDRVIEALISTASRSHGV